MPPGTTVRFPLHSPTDDGLEGLYTVKPAGSLVIAPVLTCAFIPDGSCALPLDPEAAGVVEDPPPPLAPPDPDPLDPDPVVVLVVELPVTVTARAPLVPLCVVAVMVAWPALCAVTTARSPPLTPYPVTETEATLASELV